MRSPNQRNSLIFSQNRFIRSHSRNSQNENNYQDQIQINPNFRQMIDHNQILETEFFQIIDPETLHTIDTEIDLTIGIETIQTIGILDIKQSITRLF